MPITIENQQQLDELWANRPNFHQAFLRGRMQNFIELLTQPLPQTYKTQCSSCIFTHERKPKMKHEKLRKMIEDDAKIKNQPQICHNSEFTTICRGFDKAYPRLSAFQRDAKDNGTWKQVPLPRQHIGG